MADRMPSYFDHNVIVFHDHISWLHLMIYVMKEIGMIFMNYYFIYHHKITICNDVLQSNRILSICDTFIKS